MGATHTLTTRHCAWESSLSVRSRTVTHFVLNALPAITVSLRESQCFPHSRLSAFARRRYSEAHWASSLRSALEP